MIPLTLEEVTGAIGGVLEGVDRYVVGTCISTDSRTVQPGNIYWALPGDRFDGHDFCLEAMEKGATVVVIHNNKLPGIEIPCIRVPDTLHALGELARYLRRRIHCHVVGITGSVGKTSTKEFLRHATRDIVKTRATEGNFNNLVGLPKTLFGLESNDQWLVLEMGIDRPGEMKRLAEIAEPNVGVITAIGEAHLERMGSLERICAEKSELLKNLSPDGIAVIPKGCRFREELRDAASAPTTTFGVEDGAEYLAVDPKVRTKGCYRFLLESPQGNSEVNLRVPGFHQVFAATAAAAVALSSGLPLKPVMIGLQNFTGLPGRCQLVDLEGGITAIADHYNANPVSMAAAQRLLETFLERRKVFVAGEMWDLGSESAALHRMVGEKLGAGSIDLLVAVGNLTRHLVQGAQNVGFPSRKIRWFETVESASFELQRLLRPADVVLVKGSRGMKMEGILEFLTHHLGKLPLLGEDHAHSVCGESGGARKGG